MKLLFRLYSVALFLLLSTSFTASANESSDPVNTVNSVIKDLSQYKLVSIWNAMPASYQTDVNNLVGKFIKTLDKDTYHSYVNLFKRLTVVLKGKRVIFNAPVKPGTEAHHKRFISNLDKLIVIMDAIVSSQISDYDQMLKPDIGRFVSGAGTNIFKTAISANAAMQRAWVRNVANVSVKQVSRTANEVLLDEVKNGKVKGKPEAYVIVEGKWIPKTVQANWKAEFVKLNLKVDGMQAKSKQQNESLQKILPLLDQFITNLEKMDDKNKLAQVPAQIGFLMQQISSTMIKRPTSMPKPISK